MDIILFNYLKIFEHLFTQKEDNAIFNSDSHFVVIPISLSKRRDLQEETDFDFDILQYGFAPWRVFYDK